MTTELERRLQEALREDAQRARLVNRDRPRTPDIVLVSEPQQRARPHRSLAGVAAAIALVASAGIVAFQIGRDQADVTPATLDPTLVVTDEASESTVPSVPDPDSEAPVPSPMTDLFTDLAPDSTLPLPPAPFDLGQIPGAVWTGTEIIVWGGIGAGNESVPDGAALNMATGIWRIIAAAPIEGRSHFQLAWTGTEMIVTGGLFRDGTLTDDGSYNQTVLTDAAAYNPATDTWRRLPDAPIPTADSDAVWTGHEVVVVGVGGDTSAAYDPATNTWRRLADVPVLAPGAIRWGQAVWTGRTILTTLDEFLTRYEPSTDTWHIDHDARYAALVGVPDADGVTRTVIGLPLETGAPVQLLDDTGTVIGSLPGHPADLDMFGDYVEAVGGGVWVGEEAVFRIVDPDWGAGLGPPAGYDDRLWALNPTTQTWRRLPAGLDTPILAAGDILLASPDGDDPSPAILYRAPTTGAADSTADDDGET